MDRMMERECPPERKDLITQSDRGGGNKATEHVHTLRLKDGDAQASAGSCRATVIFVQVDPFRRISGIPNRQEGANPGLQNQRRINMLSCIDPNKGLIIGMVEKRTQFVFFFAFLSVV